MLYASAYFFMNILEYCDMIELEPIIEFPEDCIDVAWYDFSGMALAGCPSSKDVARIATQKSMDKGPPSEEEEESSESEEDEDLDPKAAAEKKLQKEIKSLNNKVKTFA